MLKTCVVDGRSYTLVTSSGVGSAKEACESCAFDGGVPGDRPCQKLNKPRCPGYTYWILDDPGVRITVEREVTTIEAVTKVYNIPQREMRSVQQGNACCADLFSFKGRCKERNCSSCLLSGENRDALWAFFVDNGVVG